MSWISSLLTTLDELTEWQRSFDFEDMTTVVRLVGNTLEVDVCSLFLKDPRDHSLVLAATVGLRWQDVGKTRLKRGEGLIGLAMRNRKPLLVHDATTHSRYVRGHDGEEDYETFFAVPLIDGWKTRGVLVVETLERKEFVEHESRLLRAVADRIAPHLEMRPMMIEAVPGRSLQTA